MIPAFLRGGGWGCEAQSDDREAVQSAEARGGAVVCRPSSALPTWDPVNAPPPAGPLGMVGLRLDTTISVKSNNFILLWPSEALYNDKKCFSIVTLLTINHLTYWNSTNWLHKNQKWGLG